MTEASLQLAAALRGGGAAWERRLIPRARGHAGSFQAEGQFNNFVRLGLYGIAVLPTGLVHI